jgi:hypothetical protein
MDGGGFELCTSPRLYQGLTDGEHTFAVRATDPAGNTDPTPDERTFTVDTSLPPDTTAPVTTIDSGPTGTIAQTTASFTFSSNEPGSSFECQIDDNGWDNCNPPYTVTDLPDGPHTFAVRATDPAGNTDSTPASRGFTVNTSPPDTTAPDTFIDGGPTGTIDAADVTFRFSASEGGASFECKLDSGNWAGCTSPKSYAGLSNGTHTFFVRAKDASGNVDASPASQSFNVQVTTTNPPPPPPTGPSAACSSAQKQLSSAQSALKKAKAKLKKAKSKGAKKKAKAKVKKAKSKVKSAQSAVASAC